MARMPGWQRECVMCVRLEQGPAPTAEAERKGADMELIPGSSFSPRWKGWATRRFWQGEK